MALNLELAQTKGILAQKEQEALELKVRLEGLRDSIRQNLQPFVPLEDLRGDIVAQQGFEFADRQNDYKALLCEIQSIRKALGR